MRLISFARPASLQTDNTTAYRFLLLRGGCSRPGAPQSPLPRSHRAIFRVMFYDLKSCQGLENGRSVSEVQGRSNKKVNGQAHDVVERRYKRPHGTRRVNARPG